MEDETAAQQDFAKAISLGISKEKSDAVNDLQFLITLRSKAGPLAEFRDPKAAVVLARKLVELDRTTDFVLLEAACLAESEQYLRAQELLLGRIREVEDAEEKSRLQAAVETFRTQSKFGPALEGLELEKDGKYEEAMDRYTKVLDQAPETAWVLVRRAFCLAKTGILLEQKRICVEQCAFCLKRQRIGSQWLGLRPTVLFWSFEMEQGR